MYKEIEADKQSEDGNKNNDKIDARNNDNITEPDWQALIRNKRKRRGIWLAR